MNALAIELEKSGLPLKLESPVAVLYDGQPVGNYVADMIINNEIICEIKAVQHLAAAHEVQLVNYLSATGIDLGLLINFGSSVEVKRKYRMYLSGTNNTETSSSKSCKSC